eukprot:5974515-Prymnesium_polylepis.1
MAVVGSSAPPSAHRRLRDALLALPPVRSLIDWNYAWWLIAPVLLGETLLCALIIWRVPYTKIDWDAYMQE